MNKLLALLSAGAPGLNRLLFASFIVFVFGSNADSTAVLLDLTLVVSLSMVLSMGFSIMQTQKVDLVEEVTFICGSYLFGFIGFLLITLSSNLFLKNPTFSSFLFVGLIGYQNVRHRLIKGQRFAFICQLEFFLWGIFIFAVSVFQSELSPPRAFLLFSLSFLPFFALDLFYFIRNFRNPKGLVSVLKQGMFIGLTNLLSSGIAWILPSIGVLIFLPEQISLVASLAFILGFVSLIPRTYLNRKIVEINQTVKEANLDNLYYLNKNLKRLLAILLPVTFISASVYVICIVSTEYLSLSNLVLVFLAVAVSVIMQFTVIDSTILTYLKSNQLTLKFGIYFSVLLSVCAAVLYFVKYLEWGLPEGWYALIFYLMLIGLSLIRNHQVRCAVVNQLREKASCE